VMIAIRVRRRFWHACWVCSGVAEGGGARHAAMSSLRPPSARDCADVKTGERRMSDKMMSTVISILFRLSSNPPIPPSPRVFLLFFIANKKRLPQLPERSWHRGMRVYLLPNNKEMIAHFLRLSIAIFSTLGTCVVRLIYEHQRLFDTITSTPSFTR